jgi:antitoxin CcdA
MRMKTKPTNLSLDAALVAEAKGYGINLSQAMNRHLRDLVIQQRASAWAAENAEAIEAERKHIETYGLWSDGRRQW